MEMLTALGKRSAWRYGETSSIVATRPEQLLAPVEGEEAALAPVLQAMRRGMQNMPVGR